MSPRERGRAMSQVEVEDAMLDEVDHLEALTNGGASPKDPTGEVMVGYDQVCSMAAEAEADWKIAQARGMIAQANRRDGGRAEAKHTQEARVLAVNEDLFRAYKVTAAVKDSSKEALVTSRARIDALRTIAANVRAQT